MYVTVVYALVKPERISDFVEASRLNNEGARGEPGNMRFDILQMKDDPTRFLLYEAYATEEASAAHKETAHYRAWRDAVADMLAEPRTRDVYNGLFV